MRNPSFGVLARALFVPCLSHANNVGAFSAGVRMGIAPRRDAQIASKQALAVPAIQWRLCGDGSPGIAFAADKKADGAVNT